MYLCIETIFCHHDYVYHYLWDSLVYSTCVGSVYQVLYQLMMLFWSYLNGNDSQHTGSVLDITPIITFSLQHQMTTLLETLIYSITTHQEATHDTLKVWQCHKSNSPCIPNALSPGVEHQILGIKISAHVIQLWHVHCKRLNAAVKIHNALV